MHHYGILRVRRFSHFDDVKIDNSIYTSARLVHGGRRSRSAVGKSPAEPSVADGVAVLERCTASDPTGGVAQLNMPPGVRARLRIVPEVFRGAHIAQQDRIAQRVHTCPLCGAEPGKSCCEKARGGLGRKTYLARPHAERAELVHAEHGLATSQASSASRLR